MKSKLLHTYSSLLVLYGECTAMHNVEQNKLEQVNSYVQVVPQSSNFHSVSRSELCEALIQMDFSTILTLISANKDITATESRTLELFTNLNQLSSTSKDNLLKWFTNKHCFNAAELMISLRADRTILSNQTKAWLIEQENQIINSSKDTNVASINKTKTCDYLKLTAKNIIKSINNGIDITVEEHNRLVQQKILKNIDNKWLLVAVNNNCIEFVKFLIENNVDVNYQNNKNCSASILALQNNNLDMLYLLIQNHAITDETLNYALTHERWEVVPMLQVITNIKSAVNHNDISELKYIIRNKINSLTDSDLIFCLNYAETYVKLQGADNMLPLIKAINATLRLDYLIRNQSLPKEQFKEHFITNIDQLIANVFYDKSILQCVCSYANLHKNRDLYFVLDFLRFCKDTISSTGSSLQIYDAITRKNNKLTNNLTHKYKEQCKYDNYSILKIIVSFYIKNLLEYFVDQYKMYNMVLSPSEQSKLLSYACDINNHEAVLQLLSEEVSTTQEDCINQLTSDQQKYVFWLAMENKRYDLLELLINKGIDLNKIHNKDNLTPIMFALQNDQRMTEWLIEKKAKLSEFYTMIRQGERISDKDLAQLQKLYLIISKNNKQEFRKQQEELFWLAMQHECIKLLEFMANNGIDINQIRDTGNSSPIIFATEVRSEKITKWLLQHGAKLKDFHTMIKQDELYNQDLALLKFVHPYISQKQQEKFFWLAMKNKHIKLLKFLIKKGINLNKCRDQNGYSPLMFAIIRNFPKDVKQYIAKHQTNLDEFSMMIHNWDKPPNNLALLKKAYSLLTEKNQLNFFWFAIDSEYLDLVNFILTKKIDINKIRNNDNITPLMFALQMNTSTELIQLLIDHGANLESLENAIKNNTNLSENALFTFMSFTLCINKDNSNQKNIILKEWTLQQKYKFFKLAVQYNHIQVIKYFINNVHMNLDELSHINNPDKSEEMMRLLIKYKSEIYDLYDFIKSNKKIPEDKLSLLQQIFTQLPKELQNDLINIAIQYNQVDFLKLLVDTDQIQDKCTPLMFALQINASTELIKWLIDHGANLELLENLIQTNSKINNDYLAILESLDLYTNDNKTQSWALQQKYKFFELAVQHRNIQVIKYFRDNIIMKLNELSNIYSSDNSNNEINSLSENNFELNRLYQSIYNNKEIFYTELQHIFPKLSKKLQENIFLTAIDHECIWFLKFAIKHGIDINKIRDHENDSLLMSAIKINSSETLLKWLIRNGARLDSLQEELFNSNTDIQQSLSLQLLDYFIVSNTDKFIRNSLLKQENGLFWLAIENNNENLLEYFLDHNIDIQTVYNKNGISPLMFAVKQNYCNIVSLLLTNGANLNPFNEMIHRSKQLSDNDLVLFKRLMPYISNKIKERFFWKAIRHYHINLMNLLVDNGINIHQIRDRYNITPIMSIVIHYTQLNDNHKDPDKFKQLINWLLQHGDDFVSLEQMIKFKTEELLVLEYLTVLKDLISAEQRENFFKLAIQHNNVYVVKFFLMNNINMNAIVIDNLSPTMYAVQNNRSLLQRTLIKYSKTSTELLKLFSKHNWMKHVLKSLDFNNQDLNKLKKDVKFYYKNKINTLNQNDTKEINKIRKDKAKILKVITEVLSNHDQANKSKIKMQDIAEQEVIILESLNIFNDIPTPLKDLLISVAQRNNYSNLQQVLNS